MNLVTFGGGNCDYLVIDGLTITNTQMGISGFFALNRVSINNLTIGTSDGTLTITVLNLTLSLSLSFFTLEKNNFSPSPKQNKGYGT